MAGRAVSRGAGHGRPPAPRNTAPRNTAPRNTAPRNTAAPGGTPTADRALARADPVSPVARRPDRGADHRRPGRGDPAEPRGYRPCPPAPRRGAPPGAWPLPRAAPVPARRAADAARAGTPACRLPRPRAGEAWPAGRGHGQRRRTGRDADLRPHAVRPDTAGRIRRPPGSGLFREVRPPG